MKRIAFMFKQFLREPLWFKILISTTLLFALIFSDSYFANHPAYQGFSKLVAAIFFIAYGMKMRRNRTTAIILFAAAAICLYLAWNKFELMG
ncbi:hypothetical protein GC098_00795 [Paenibacillus sp. LMG 31458]|uniref:Uncharacterized protein n=1 Tax=Paenibacillus phytorum TaxID=2654977 RepID=A0ABX1XN61_9BACL|nr:hypothetical protein [Paenibacillus phytorum]NOU69985.1 hypothetical protein [Paenibacillus phytorum]